MVSTVAGAVSPYRGNAGMLSAKGIVDQIVTRVNALLDRDLHAPPRRPEGRRIGFGQPRLRAGWHAA